MFGWEGIDFEWEDRWTLALLALAWGLVVVAVALLGWLFLAMALGAAL